MIQENCILSLLKMHQQVRRKPDLSPMDDNSAEVSRAGDAALVILSDLSMVANNILEEAGWSLADDDGRTAYGHEESCLMQRVPPVIDNLTEFEEVLLELPTLITPWETLEDGLCSWPMKVRRVGKRYSVVDVQVEGSGSIIMRRLIDGHWKGSDCLAELCLTEEAGKDVETWEHTTMVGIAHLLQNSPKKILVIGDPGGVLSIFLARHMPACRIDVLQDDEELAGIAEDLFRLDDFANARIYQQQISAFLENTKNRYDVVIADSIADISGVERVTATAIQRCEVKLNFPNVSRVFEEEQDLAISVGSTKAIHFDPSAWSKTPKLPFFLEAVDEIDTSEWVMLFSEVGVENVAKVQKVDASAQDDDMWALFGGDAPNTEKPEDVSMATAVFWEQLCDGQVSCGTIGDQAKSLLEKPHKELHSDLLQHGYIVGAQSFAKDNCDKINLAMQKLEDAGFPPTFVFMYDVAWESVRAVWRHVEQIIGPCWLEPSIAAFKLNYSKSSKGERYVGNNFGMPHRDYNHIDSLDEEGNPKVLSIWVPTNDINHENGCMYLVPREHDVKWETEEYSGAMHTPQFKPTSVKIMAPYPAGTMMGWTGNTIHWGSKCEAGGAEDPRKSIALVFRRTNTTPDREATPITFEESGKLSVGQRLKICERALMHFSHWYNIPADLESRLSKALQEC